MGYVLLAVGILLSYLDFLGAENVRAAGSLAYAETFGDARPFYKWAGAMIILLAIGYIPDMEPVATAMMVLILTVIIINNSSGFTKLIKGA